MRADLVQRADACGQRAHDLQRERRRLVHQEDEGALVDDGDLRRLRGDSGEAARGLGDDRELAERLARAERGDDVVAVYLPMSYMVGGYTLFMPRWVATQTSMSSM